MRKSIAFTVTNDLCYDQRMHRICKALATNDYDCVLIGRIRSKSADFSPDGFRAKRIRCLFETGFLFYAEYNLRILVLLLRLKTDIICSIDTDTLLAGVLAARIRKKRHVLDAHEFFTEMEELVSRPRVQSFWRVIEKVCMKYVSAGYTISEGYSRLFYETYGLRLQVIRNVPEFETRTTHSISSPTDIILYQGAINTGRGLPECIEAMLQLQDVRLRIIGDGPIKRSLKQQVLALNLEQRVEIIDSVKPEILRSYTSQAHIGLTLFSHTGLHHRHSLANRFFDYIHAGVPQVAMLFPEYERFNSNFEVALLIDELRPEQLAAAINTLLTDTILYNRLRSNCKAAAQVNNWQEEQKKLIMFYENL